MLPSWMQSHARKESKEGGAAATKDACEYDDAAALTPKPKKTVAICVDGSAASDQIFTWALKIVGTRCHRPCTLFLVVAPQCHPCPLFRSWHRPSSCVRCSSTWPSPAIRASLSFLELSGLLPPHPASVDSKVDSVHLVSVAAPPPFTTNDNIAYVAGDGTGLDMAAHDIVAHGKKICDEMAASQEEAQKRMAEMGAEVGLKGDRLQRHVIKTDVAGSVGQTAVAASEKLGADIVIFGSRGLSALQKTLLGVVGLGSVSDFAVRA